MTWTKYWIYTLKKCGKFYLLYLKQKWANTVLLLFLCVTFMRKMFFLGEKDYFVGCYLMWDKRSTCVYFKLIKRCLLVLVFLIRLDWQVTQSTKFYSYRLSLKYSAFLLCLSCWWKVWECYYPFWPIIAQWILLVFILGHPVFNIRVFWLASFEFTIKNLLLDHLRKRQLCCWESCSITSGRSQRGSQYRNSTVYFV